MITYNKETPILFIAFGDIETITLLFDELRKIEVRHLYLACDRDDTIGKEQLKPLITGIDWDCQVNTMYNKTNLGYDKTMLKAVKWFFEHEPEGIILDGRDIPFPSFFAFCSALLEKYREDERIGHISGCDFHPENRKQKNEDSYHFSKLINTASCWASWRRVWKDFDAQVKTFPTFKKRNVIEDIPVYKPFRFQWHHLDYLNSSWIAKYEYINLINNRLSIVPNMHQLTDEANGLQKITHPIFMTDCLDEELKHQELKFNIPAVTKNNPEGYTFLKNKLLSLSDKTTDRMHIPRIIHHIYEDPAGPPANLLTIAETWKEKHPDWEYRFWNRKMINDFIESTCPDFSAYYHSFPFDVQRWDAIRYLILYHIGGVYMDLDYECIQPLDVLLTDSSCCMGMDPIGHARVQSKPMMVGNALMAAAPKHKFFQNIIEDMKANFTTDNLKGKFLHVLESTGPLMVTRVYENFKRKQTITLLSADLIAPLSQKEVWILRTGHPTPAIADKIEKAFAIHYFFNSWISQTAEGKT
ncbi:hypothetical protein AGMMS4957_03790 [Bacteroidia bacterium]|nr:hypothetical protein AGMMS4957_03490 [Bacteroidia bacterium]GHT19468.1 hypothetical protein AGMMS4957_03790 [Bacteroidia bacterium]